MIRTKNITKPGYPFFLARNMILPKNETTDENQDRIIMGTVYTCGDTNNLYVAEQIENNIVVVYRSNLLHGYEKIVDGKDFGKLFKESLTKYTNEDMLNMVEDNILYVEWPETREDIDITYVARYLIDKFNYNDLIEVKSMKPMEISKEERSRVMSFARPTRALNNLNINKNKK